MEELNKQVRVEILRTLLWMTVSIGAALGAYYVLW
jgi:hypothetical protein